MTPLMIGKRIANSMSTAVEKHTHSLAPEPPNHMNIHTTSHSVPGELMYAFGSKAIKDLRLRSGMSINVFTISAGGESHKHSFASNSEREAMLLLYLGKQPSELGYTDPRNNEFHTTTMSLGDTFILSSHHPFHLSNIYSDTPAVYLAVNAHLNWTESVRHWQHTW
jgi:hypothetical protein